MGLTIALWWPKLALEIDKAQIDADEAKRKAENIPKKYNYLCVNCLFQTNEYTKICPRCERQELTHVFEFNEKITNEIIELRGKID
jgi:hypothetical protein